jgi:ribosome-associated protein
MLVLEKLANRINAEGALMVKSQIHRTQLANKEEVTKRINELIRQALHRKKPRIATKIKRSAIEKRLESKKRHADLKAGRKKYRAGPAE